MLFYQPLDGYAYNSDSIFLFEFITLFNPKGRVLDVGSGCGVVGLLVAKQHPKTELFAVEIQERFCTLTRHNATINQISLTQYCGDYMEMPINQKFDLIVSNPPFYHNDTLKSENESLRLCRHQSALPLEDFLAKTNTLLAPNGEFIFCYDAAQTADIIAKLKAFKMPLIDMMHLHPTPQKPANITLFRIKKSSRSRLHIHPPRFASDGVKKLLPTHTIKCEFE